MAKQIDDSSSKTETKSSQAMQFQLSTHQQMFSEDDTGQTIERFTTVNWLKQLDEPNV